MAKEMEQQELNRIKKHDGESARSVAASPVDSAAAAMSNLSSSVASSLSDSQYSTLYCGVVCIIQSYLSFPELLRLARVSFHYRRVAMGLLNPSGMYRLGTELPHLSWDAIHFFERFPSAVLQDETKGDITNLPWLHPDDSSPSTAEPPLPGILPGCSFASFADEELEKINRQREENHAQLPLSTKELESFLAMVPAPAYGAPTIARKFSRPPKINLLLVTPIVARHVQEIDITIRTVSALALISLRLPHLRSMNINPAWLQDFGSPPPSFSWRDLTDEIRLPAQLRHLSFGAPGLDFDPVIFQMLPKQCPSLQSLRIDTIIPPSADLSPLLHLEHLTHLDLSSTIFIPKEPNPALIEVLRSLTKLKHCYVLSSPEEISNWLPTPGNALEEIIIPYDCSNVELERLAEHAPQLRSIVMDRGPFPDSWLLVDHNVLTKFQSLHTLSYGQLLFEGKLITEIGMSCLEAHGSFGAHADHVISALTQIKCLTNLRIDDLYTPFAARSRVVNRKYLKGMVDPEDIRKLDWEFAKTIQQEDEHTRKLSIGYSASSRPLRTGLQGNSLYKLTAGLPQLLHLSLSGSASYQLPSLSFLAQLSHLQSLSITRARYLPIHCMYDLRYVSSTLTRLHLKECFPRNSKNRPVFLMHDVLQPLQLSFPITQVATIKFPSRMRKPADVTDPSSSSSSSSCSSSKINHEPVDAQASFEFEQSFALSSSLDSSTCPLLRPRHSSWLQVLREPNNPIGSSSVPSLLELLQTRDPDATEKNMDSSQQLPQAKSERQRLQESEDENIYRHVCDSFTVVVRPSDLQTSNAILKSMLLPNLVSCRIDHIEAHVPCGFIYDRFTEPQYQLLCGEGLKYPVYMKGDLDAAKRKRTSEDREKMHALYGLDMRQVQELDHWSYCCFMKNCADAYNID